MPKIERKYVIRGDHMTPDGYIDDLRPKKLEVASIGGKAYNYIDILADHGVPLADLRLVVDRHGYLGNFHPDDGEIDRIGRELFTA